MSTIAVFLALGGSALAIKANSVGSRQIKDDSIKGRDVADAKLKGKDLKAGTIGSREIDPDLIGPVEPALMRSTDSSCDPTSTAFVPCGTLTLGLSGPGQTLLVAGGGQRGTAGAAGICKFRVDNAELVPTNGSTPFGDAAPRDLVHTNGIALTTVTDMAGPGITDFQLVCNETEGDISFRTTFSAVAVGNATG